MKTKTAVSLRKETREKKDAEKMKANEEAESRRAELELRMIGGVGEDGQTDKSWKTLISMRLRELRGKLRREREERRVSLA